MSEHLNKQGQFVSDWIVGLPANVVPLKIGGQVDDLLWQIAHRYEHSDKPIFGADLKKALVNMGYPDESK